MPKFKIVVPLIVEAVDENEARLTAVDAVKDVEFKENVSFFNEEDVVEDVEELDEDNLDDTDDDEEKDEEDVETDTLPDEQEEPQI